MEEDLNNKDIENYFIDITYRIIPKNKKNYKLLTISGLNKHNNNTNILAFIFLKYEDYNSLKKIFSYFIEMYDFAPKIVNIDFSNALHKVFSDETVFKNKPIIIHCFFHFTQAIVKKMKQLKLINLKLNKHNFELIKNIELICFLQPKYIKSYVKFLKQKLNQDKEEQLFLYLEKQWFSKSYNYYNYNDIFKNNSFKKILPHFYATNNIAESLHSKINNYLPSRKICCNNFILSLRNIIQYNEIKKNDIPRKDYITKTLVYYADTVKDNKFTWIKYEKFKEMEKNIIMESKNKYND